MGVTRTRLLFGTPIVALTVTLFWFDRTASLPILSCTVLAILAILAQHEFYVMLRSAGVSVAHRLGMFVGVYYLLTRFLPLAFSEETPLFDAGAHLAAAVTLLLVIGVLCGKSEGAPQRLAATLSGLLFVPFLLGYAIEVRHLPDGWAWLVFLVAVAKTGDSAAFFVGKSIGRHKLIPSVSPNKTWEGAVGSVFGSLFAAWLVATYLFSEPPSVGVWLSAALLVNVSAQFGDLAESLLKRGCSVKDSGGLVPVMGGILDLVDSFLIAAPLLRLFLAFIPPIDGGALE